MRADDSGPHISIAAGIVIGLVASFVQSLGLTVQRLSHISNEQLPPEKRRRDWKRPLWLAGFAVFILSNIFGTLFQIGALPIVVLGPLGAVSLLWNAIFARIILGDVFTVQLAIGSVLIAGGATLVGIFGVVPEQTHTLPELIALYRRPAFVTWIALLTCAIVLVLFAAHLAEWRLARRHGSSSTGALRVGRRWSLPLYRPARPSEDECEPLLAADTGDEPRRGKHARFAERIDKAKVSSLGSDAEETAEQALARAERARVWVAIGYGATSGTLSGVCLLITKTGIDLLISTITSRENQFGHIEAWVILVVLLVCELFQLAYLNRALRLVGPTLVCPLSFCFYNCASILSGLIFYKQVDALSRLQAAMVALGSAVLLGGVWVVSVKTGTKPKDEGSGEERWTQEPLELETEDDACSSDEETVAWHPRGFSIGLGAASPGFEIRPAVLHRAHTYHPHPSAPFSPSPLPSPGVDLAASTASLPAAGRVAQRPSRRRKGHGLGRSESLSGALYVGEELDCGHHRTEGLPTTPAVVDVPPRMELRLEREGAEGKAVGAGGWWTRVRDRLRGSS